ncbi:cytochrome c [Devosia enhydra]|uniref:Cytochrome c n=1 Tax=Devosia enhydra TaxID=665118 RepID=A0A1K2I208_9HYPH|nr:c-type cytochrome [Devosia enhydra]SFZ86426.1 cytochrome c [Devosia enhydra]
MDSFELNKIMGAVLGTLLFVMGAGLVAEIVYHPHATGPGYNLPEPEPTGAAVAGPVEPEIPLGVLLASASADRGAAAAAKCQSCHNFGEGQPNKTGPNLYGIVGAAVAHLDNYAYSDIFMQYHNEGRTWTYEELEDFLRSPRAHAPGTKMNFAGIRTANERADILAYLQTLSATPVPFPAAELPEAEAPPSTEGTEPVTVTPPVTDTPTTTQSETPVVGTPTTSGTTGVSAQPETGTPANETVVPEAAPAAEAAPANTAAPAAAAPTAPANATEAPANAMAPMAPAAAPSAPATPAPTAPAVPANTLVPGNAVAPTVGQ